MLNEREFCVVMNNGFLGINKGYMCFKKISYTNWIDRWIDNSNNNRTSKIEDKSYQESKTTRKATTTTTTTKTTTKRREYNRLEPFPFRIG